MILGEDVENSTIGKVLDVCRWNGRVADSVLGHTAASVSQTWKMLVINLEMFSIANKLT